MVTTPQQRSKPGGLRYTAPPSPQRPQMPAFSQEVKSKAGHWVRKPSASRSTNAQEMQASHTMLERWRDLAGPRRDCPDGRVGRSARAWGRRVARLSSPLSASPRSPHATLRAPPAYSGPGASAANRAVPPGREVTDRGGRLQRSSRPNAPAFVRRHRSRAPTATAAASVSPQPSGLASPRYSSMRSRLPARTEEFARSATWTVDQCPSGRSLRFPSSSRYQSRPGILRRRPRNKPNHHAAVRCVDDRRRSAPPGLRPAPRRGLLQL